MTWSQTRIQLKFAPLHSVDRIPSKYGVLIVQKPKGIVAIQIAGRRADLLYTTDSHQHQPLPLA